MTWPRFCPTGVSFCWRLVGLLLGFSVPAVGAADPGPGFSVESGVIWQVGRLTPLPYRLIPTQVSWRSGTFLGRTLPDGSRLLLRNRLTLFATAIPSGPESRYVALAASPSIEWWNPAGTWAWYGGAGGGAGAIDSRGVRGGQGQDFTLTWFARGGIEWIWGRQASLTAGVLFQHMSNGGRTDPNPGIDALGFTAGLAWRY